MSATESKGGLKEVGEGFKAILERIADFFDIFDLSFIVSGATSAAAIAFWGWKAQIAAPPIPHNWVGGVGLLIGAYVLGLVCFALGRWIRMGWRWTRAEQSFYIRFVRILDGHGLSRTTPFSTYLARREARGDWRLYVLMWAELRNTARLQSSFSLLRRYWVMAATYDGVAISLVVWALAILGCVLHIGGAKPIDPLLGVPLAIALCISAIACSREGERYVTYQVEELVASIASVRKENGACTSSGLTSA